LPIYQYLSYSTLNPTILPPSDPKKKLPSTHTTKKKKKKRRRRREKREERREKSPLPYPHPPCSSFLSIKPQAHHIIITRHSTHIYNILDITTTQKTNIERKQEKGR